MASISEFASMKPLLKENYPFLLCRTIHKPQVVTLGANFRFSKLPGNSFEIRLLTVNKNIKIYFRPCLSFFHCEMLTKDKRNKFEFKKN